MTNGSNSIGECQIRQTIADLRRRLKHPDMNKPVNKPIREGYTESVNILLESRENYDGIDKLSTQQGRAIAILAVDYLKGECTKEILTGVPLE